ncbi:MAG: HlyD family secretion protein [Gemmatimonadales bacterium]
MNRTRFAVILLVAIVIAGGWYAFTRSRGDGGALAASGTVEATEAALGVQVAGRLETVRVHEGDIVKARDTLGALDRRELAARRAQAVAQHDAARALLSEMVRGARPEELAQAREADSTAAVRLADAQKDFERAQPLARTGTISQQALDKSRLALEVARSQRDQAAQQLQLVRSGPREERVAGQRALVAQADAAVRQIDAMLANAVVIAPFDGIVSARNREPGETVAAGSPVITLLNLADRWVRIYVAEDRVGTVKIGQEATITTDTYKDRQYRGAVSFIASEAEFTPRNVQTQAERVKLVYAVKVRIAGDSTTDLKPGMPVDVKLR